MNKRIIAVHLLNDRSGSPLILRQSLEALKEYFEVILYTATPSGDGFLSNLSNVEERTIFYKWHNSKLVTLIYFLVAQIALFSKLLFVLRKEDTLYINTLLPFGAAFAGFIKRSKIVYHVHETSLKPAILKGFLFQVANKLATKVIFVSKYVGTHYQFTKPETEVIYNCLPNSFINNAEHIKRLNLKHPFTVTMLCSLKEYKGIFHFVNIAKKMPGLQFQMVLNSSQKNVDDFVNQVNPPANCKIYATQKDTLPFYEAAHVVLNLSKPTGWVETFGMTILEAMHCGRPVICPPVGGVLELVTDNQEGFTIDSNNEDGVCEALRKLSSDINYYEKMSKASLAKSTKFDPIVFRNEIVAAFAGIPSFQKMQTKYAEIPEFGN
jgi:L-malate glycosyltransferase